jgi:uncharacterized protein (DUF1501 family)
MSQGFITPKDSPEHTMIVVFLRGGADGLNLVAPIEDDVYYRVRPRIGITKDEAIRLDDMFGLNPRLAGLEAAYKDGDLAIVHQTGSEDATRSHFEAQDLMEHGGLVGGGWLGRYLRFSAGTSAWPLAAVAIGKTQPECMRGAPAAVTFESFDALSLGSAPTSFHNELARLYALEQDFLSQAGRDTLRALESVQKLRDAKYQPANGAKYPDGGFGRGLSQMAHMIKAEVGLRAACIDLDGWDTHLSSQSIMTPLMEALGNGLQAFRQDLGPLMAHTTVVVMTEFGRRAYENVSLGTDHGRASAMFVMGGGVNGGRVVNEWKGLENDILEGPGDLPVVYNYRNVLAAVMSRHGHADILNQVFPEFSVAPLELYA